LVEQAQLLELLRTERITVLAADWGLGKEGFLAAAIAELADGSAQKTVRVDLEGVRDLDGLHSAFSEQLGTSVQVFAFRVAKQGGHVLVLDNVDLDQRANVDNRWPDQLLEVVRALSDFSQELKSLIVARSEYPKLGLSCVRIGPFDLADTRQYISDHPEGGQALLEEDCVDTLHSLSRGVPMQLDHLIRSLQLVSLAELVEIASSDSDGLESGNEPIPVALQQAIDHLIASEDHSGERSLILLKVLSVLAYGESLETIQRFDATRPIYLAHVKQLHENGLLETHNVSTLEGPRDQALGPMTKNATGPKLLIVPPQVRNYILSLLDTKEVDAIVKRCAE